MLKALFVYLTNPSRRNAANTALLNDHVTVISYGGSNTFFKKHNGELFARYICKMASKNYVSTKKLEDKERRKKTNA